MATLSRPVVRDRRSRASRHPGARRL